MEAEETPGKKGAAKRPHTDVRLQSQLSNSREDAAGPSATPNHPPKDSEECPRESASENERGESDSSDNEEEFDDDKVQSVR